MHFKVQSQRFSVHRTSPRCFLPNSTISLEICFHDSYVMGRRESCSTTCVAFEASFVSIATNPGIRFAALKGSGCNLCNILTMLQKHCAMTHGSLQFFDDALLSIWRNNSHLMKLKVGSALCICFHSSRGYLFVAAYAIFILLFLR